MKPNMSNREKHLLEMTLDLLKSDPVEWSEAFEDMIDEVEKELCEYFKDKNCCMGFCE